MMRDARVVLYVEHMAEVGGGQVSLLELLRTIDREKYTPVVTCVSRCEFFERVKSLGVDTEIVDIRNVLRKNPVHTIGNMRDLSRVIRDRGVDLIHVNSLKALLTVCIPARLNRVPLIWHCRVTSDYGKFFDLLGCLCADAIVVPSRFLSARLRWLGLCGRKEKLIYNAVDAGVFDTAAVAGSVREELGVPGAAFVVGAAGRLEEEKGFHHLIRAAPEVARRVPEVRFLVVGGDPPGISPYAESLRRTAAESPLASSILFTGYRRDVRECLAAMDIVVVPSQREAFGRVAVEAMALGKPVVASAVGGLPEVVEDGVTGVLVPPGDAEALAEALVRLRDDRAMAGRMGAAGRRRAEELFDLRVHVNEIEKLYDEIIGGASVGSPAEGGSTNEG